MTQLKRGIVLKVLALLALTALPLSASQGRGGGPPPPSLPPAPVTLVNPTAADCYSGPGCLDPSFGTLGRVQQDIGGDSQYMQVIAIQPDGMIVAAGARWVGLGTPNTWDQSWVIGRFTPNGTLDTSFGLGGLFTLDVIAGQSSETPLGVAVQADGNIVVAGRASGGGSSYMTAIRLSSAGVLDSTFGSAGKVMISVASGTSSGGMVIQADGKLVIALGEASAYARVTRLLANGAVDTKFGSKGSRLVLDMNPNAIALQSAGRVVLAGSHVSAEDGMLARLTPAGELDTSFGNRGSTVVSFSSQRDAFLSLSVASDDSIAAGGHANWILPVDAHLAVARFTANGALVTGFGSSGRVVLDVHGFFDSVRAVTLRADGRVEFAGYGAVSGQGVVPTHNRNVIVGRLTSTGALDSSFGSGGVTETAFGAPALGMAAAVGPDGLLTVAGTLLDAAGLGGEHWLLSRYFR